VKLREIADEVDRRQAESKTLAAKARRLEVAINLKPLWTKREKVDDQLERFAGLVPLEEGTLDTLDDLNQRLEEHERQRDIHKGQRHQLRDEAERLGINDLLVRNGLRLEALAEQQEWLVALEKLSAELTDEVSRLETRLASENERLSHEWTGAGDVPPEITADVIDQLAPQAKAIEATEEFLTTARRELEARRVGEHRFRTEIETAMTGGEKIGLPMDVDEAGDLVARLRRRMQVEQRLNKSREHAGELQQQSQDLIDEQVVPVSLFSWLLAVFVLGFVSLAAWIMLPETVIGKYGGWIAAVGIGGSVFAWLLKYFVEDSAADRLDACHKQLDLVGDQIREAQDEMQQLDRELPITEGSVAMRLEHAERHLAELERMLPVESKRREAAQEITAAERRLELAQEKHAAAEANWKNKLRALGLPDDVHPDNLATMAGQFEQVQQLSQRIDNRRDDAARREREFETVSRRIFALAEETGLRVEDAEPLEQLDELLAEYRQQQQRVAHREEIRERAKTLKADEARHGHAAVGVRRRREALFQNCGVDDEHGLRQLADRLAEAEELRKQRVNVTREIAAAIGKHGGEADFAPLLAPETVGRLEHDWESLTSQVEQIDRGLKDLLQERGAMVEQQRVAAADRSLAEKQLDLDVVEQQIALKRAAWRERAAVSLLLERIREEYEQHRQPETLREASRYMSQLTSGKYARIWTPLANDILLVETADGQSLPVDVLSRGTREQLFVSLRLALVAAYARRGIHLPMILDDVFVNFDAGRTKIAVEVLRNFAREGHQLMVFTCHEHIWRMFGELKVDSRRVPNRYNNNAEIIEPLEEPAELEEEAVVEPEPVELIEPDTELETLPEPVVVEAELIEPEPVPEPEPVEVAEKPVAVELKELEYDLPAAPAIAPLAEVEYWWNDELSDSDDDAEHHPAPLGAEYSWPSEPMIHRPG
jgi:uncharacterized protein YhaN